MTAYVVVFGSLSAALALWVVLAVRLRTGDEFACMDMEASPEWAASLATPGAGTPPPAPGETAPGSGGTMEGQKVPERDVPGHAVKPCAGPGAPDGEHWHWAEGDLDWCEFEDVPRPGQDAERGTGRSITGPGHHEMTGAGGPASPPRGTCGQPGQAGTNGAGPRHLAAWLRRDPSPRNFHTTALLQAGCQTEALIAFAEAVLAVTS